MAADRLSLYNGALLVLGERAISSLTENREPRRTLDRIWNRDPVKYCLEQGQWKFAMRAQRVTYNPSIEPQFGYTYAFDKPSDFVRLCGISLYPKFDPPLVNFRERGGYWFTDDTTIYVDYVSDDNAYGRDYSLWPKTFEKYVETYMAFESLDRQTSDPDRYKKVTSIMTAALNDALSKDAMAGPAKRFPTGSWVSARRGSGRE